MEAMTDKLILELALKEMSLALNNLIAECYDESGELIAAPSRKALMRARGLLPAYCSKAFKKN